MSKEFCYVGKKYCGCLVAVTVIEDRAELAKMISEWILEGLTIERMELNQWRELAERKEFGCKHRKKDDKRQMELEESK